MACEVYAASLDTGRLVGISLHVYAVDLAHVQPFIARLTHIHNFLSAYFALMVSSSFMTSSERTVHYTVLEI